MCNRGYFGYDFAVLRHIRAHFWQVHLFEFQYKCITEKWFLPLYKLPVQEHNFICCLKLQSNFFLYISVNQTIWQNFFLKSPFI